LSNYHRITPFGFGDIDKLEIIFTPIYDENTLII